LPAITQQPHLLQAALRQVIGQHVYQQGSLVAPERLRFDFAHLDPLSQEEIEKVEDLVNNFIRQNLPVIVQEIPYEEGHQRRGQPHYFRKNTLIWLE